MGLGILVALIAGAAAAGAVATVAAPEVVAWVRAPEQPLSPQQGRPGFAGQVPDDGGTSYTQYAFQ
jgi:hypothetical protein